jgi:hypothetical protein
MNDLKPLWDAITRQRHRGPSEPNVEPIRDQLLAWTKTRVGLCNLAISECLERQLCYQFEARRDYPKLWQVNILTSDQLLTDFFKRLKDLRDHDATTR